MTIYTHGLGLAEFSLDVAPLSATLTRVRRIGAVAFAMTPGMLNFTGPTLPRSLLPPNNPTKLDLAQELADAARYPLDWDAVLRTKDPLRVDEPLLPLLAWERSTDIWKSDWPLATKRYVTDIAFEMQRKKGTRAGIEQYVEVAGGQCLSIDAPPSMLFLGGEPAPEETAAWLAGLPQLRTYNYAREGSDANMLFLAEQPFNPMFFFDSPAPTRFLEDVDASQYLGQQTYLWRNGTETQLIVSAQPLGSSGGAPYQTITLPTNVSGTWFLDNNPPAVIFDGALVYVLGADAPIAARTISFVVDNSDYGGNNDIFTSVPVAPGLEPVSVKPTLVTLSGTARPGDWFLDNNPPILSDGSIGLFLPADDGAEYNIYQVIYLYDPSAPGTGPLPPGTNSFLDNTYFQFPAYTAIVKAEVSFVMPAPTLATVIEGYLVEPDLTLLWDVVGAVNAASSARDLMLVDTNVYGVVTAGIGVVAGAVIAGQMVQT